LTRGGAAAELEIRALHERELCEAAELLALAFRDNPLNCAVIQSSRPERRLRSNRHGMRALLPTAWRHGAVWVARGAPGIEGVLVSAPPLTYPLPPPSLGTRLACAAQQGFAVARRWAEVFDALHAWHPLEPHGYVVALGVHPERQRRGVGAALLAAWLAVPAVSGAFQYLETDRERNLGFYARAGFEVAGELQVQGIRIWRMQRGPD
jgi:ribosomal protein S18 acetylase RimI-like enzyme